MRRKPRRPMPSLRRRKARKPGTPVEPDVTRPCRVTRSVPREWSSAWSRSEATSAEVLEPDTGSYASAFSGEAASGSRRELRQSNEVERSSIQLVRRTPVDLRGIRTVFDPVESKAARYFNFATHWFPVRIGFLAPLELSPPLPAAQQPCRPSRESRHHPGARFGVQARRGVVPFPGERTPRAAICRRLSSPADVRDRTACSHGARAVIVQRQTS